MKVTLSREKGRISLGYKDPGTGERFILAAMTLFEGTGCWALVDVRLGRYRAPSPYSGGLFADDFCASYRPKNEQEATYVKSLLREYEERDDGQILWCTFEGIVRGQPEVNGYRPVSYFDHAGYFSMKEGLARLQVIKVFWDTFEGDPASVRIDNPLRQPSAGVVSMDIIIKRMRGELPEVKLDDSGFDTPSPPMKSCHGPR